MPKKILRFEIYRDDKKISHFLHPKETIINVQCWQKVYVVNWFKENRNDGMKIVKEFSPK